MAARCMFAGPHAYSHHHGGSRVCVVRDVAFVHLSTVAAPTNTCAPRARQRRRQLLQFIIALLKFKVTFFSHFYIIRGV